MISGDSVKINPMKTGLDPALARMVSRRIVRAFRPRRLILYGSYAYGKPNADSDLDILVVVDRVPGWPMIEKTEDFFRRDIPVAVQMEFMSRREFEDTRDIVGGLAYPADKHGKVLFEAES